MTFHLLVGDGAAILSGSSARIPAAERQVFADAHALLARAAEAASGMDAAAEAARIEGWKQGWRDAAEGAAAEVTARVADLATAFADEAARRRSEIAEAAFAGARAIVGALDRNDAAIRLALHALGQVPADERVVIACSPEIAERLEDAVRGRGDVTVEPRPDLQPLEVEILAGDGRLVAGLDVQLAALAERWGVAA